MFSFKDALKTRSGFTLIELIIVITIIAILVTAVVLDYGFAIKKARLQISVEEILALLEDAQVRSQTGVDVELAESPDDDTQVYCWSVEIVPEAEPTLYRVPYDHPADDCLFAQGELELQLQWSDQVAVEDISYTKSDLSESPLTSLRVVFLPPRGEIFIYENDLVVSDLRAVEIHVSHDPADNPVLNKVLEIVPVTSSFDILTYDDAN